MNIKIKNHINDHSNLINKNFNQIAYCVEKIAKDIKSTFKKKKNYLFCRKWWQCS